MFKLKYKLLVANLIALSMLLLSGTALAAIPITCPDGFETTVATPDRADQACSNHQTGSAQADSVEAAGATGSDNSGIYEQPCENENVSKDNCGIIAYLVDFINILSGLVGIVVTISLVFWGIQYTTARDNPQQAATARLRITQTVLSLLAYLFIFAFLQWLVPGGVL